MSTKYDSIKNSVEVTIHFEPHKFVVEPFRILVAEGKDECYECGTHGAPDEYWYPGFDCLVYKPSMKCIMESNTPTHKLLPKYKIALRYPTRVASLRDIT